MDVAIYVCSTSSEHNALMRSLIATALLLLFATACAASSAATAPTAPTSAATRPPTAVPATATPSPDYRAMRSKIEGPLASMIVALRAGDHGNAAAFYAQFNAAADEIMPKLDLDVSYNGNLLHSTIVNVRGHPNDLSALESDRRSLLTDLQ
jgi:hypothetical protein